MERVIDENASVGPEGAWYYDSNENRVCLVGLDRTVGDHYDITILVKDSLDFSN